MNTEMTFNAQNSLYPGRSLKQPRYKAMLRTTEYTYISAVTGCIHLASVLKPYKEILQSIGTLQKPYLQQEVNIKTMIGVHENYPLTMFLPVIFFKLSSI